MATPTSADEIARPLSDEIARADVVELLDRRWRSTLTLVSAAGGYGKTRALAQAVRSNEEDPVGIEFYLRLRPGHVDPTRLASALLELLGADSEQLADEHSLPDRLVDACAALSPTKLCIIIDDVHLLEGNDESVTLLSSLVRQLPTNSHLLLAGRKIPELPLARLRADDALTEVTESDLVFRAEEVDILVERHGVDPVLLTQLAGWPALIRLAVVAGKAGPQEFLMQEIVDELSPGTVRALTVAALAGMADQQLFDRCEVQITPQSLADAVPLIDVSPAGEARPHDLWAEVIGQVGARDQIDAFVERIAPWHSEHWRHDEAILLATDHGADELARSLLMQALDGSDLRLRAASTARWLELFGGADEIADDDAELLLLRGWHQRLRFGPGHGDEDVTRALALFEERGDTENEARASVEHAFRGFLAGDVGPVLDAVQRSPRLVRSGVTFLQALGEMTSAIIAELRGDFATALRHSLRAVGPGLRKEFAELTLRHRATLYFLVGDGEGALKTAHELVEHAPSPANDLLLAFTKFAIGDTRSLIERWPDVRYHESGNVREDFTFSVGSVFVDACLGLEPDLDKVRASAWDRPREHMQLALCEWSAALLAGNEEEANAQLSRQIGQLGLEDPLVIGEIRRYIVSSYVAAPDVRSHLEELASDDALGAYHLERLRLGRILVALREDTPVDWSGYCGPEHTIGAMALPWSVEIACGLFLHDEQLGTEFADTLFSLTGSRAQRWLRSLSESDSNVAAGAARLLAILPAPPSAKLTVETQPAVALVRSGERHLVTRTRVRQLLLLLVLRGSVSRGQAMTLLWPDKDIDKARNNLRITLSHLRNELQPSRQTGEPSFHLRQRGDNIVLRRSEHLSVDLWQLEDGLAQADAALAVGDRTARLEALAPVAAGWQPPLLADLVDLADVGSEVAALQAQLREATTEVAEAYLSSGEYESAEALAQKLLTQDRFDERAHAIVIASFLGAGHDLRARQAIDACLAMLDELDVNPTAATRMLLRRARYPEDLTLRSA